MTNETRSTEEILRENAALNDTVERLLSELFDLRNLYEAEIRLKQVYERMAASELDARP